MEYPGNFSTSSRARVESEKILAYRNLDQKGKNVSSGIALQALVRDCTLRIFLVFAEELCAFGQENSWSVERIYSVANQFLRKLTIQVQCDKGHGYARMISHLDGSLTQDTERQFKQSPQWKKYEDLILAVAKAQMKKLPVPVKEKAESKITGRRALVDAYMEEVFTKTGKRIKKKDIWGKHYKSRTEFERWEREDSKHVNKAANQYFTRILLEKPHLK